MLVIFKYQIRITDSQKIQMPKGAKILCAQVQHGIICIWAEVNTDHAVEERIIQVHGTGNQMRQLATGEERAYISTVQLDGFVWHIFEYTVAGF
jgi:hypothetical protein